MLYCFVFQEKVLKFVQDQIMIFRGLTSDFLKFSSFPLLKRKLTPLLNRKNVNVQKNVIRKLAFNVQISQRNKKFKF